MPGIQKTARRSEERTAKTPLRALIVTAALLGTLAIGVSLATATAPVVSIEAASDVAYTTATAKGAVNPEDKDTSFGFEYVADADFQVDGWAKAVKAGGGGIPAGEGLTPVQRKLSGLKPATTYHLRLLASNEDGTAEAIAATFETDPVAKPIVSAVTVSAVDDGSAHFSATVNPNAPEPAPVGDPLVFDAFKASWSFQCEPACSGALSGQVLAGDQPQTVEADASGLEPNLPYKVKLVASNAGGESESAQEDFKTTGLAPLLNDPGSTPLGQGKVGIGAYVNPRNAAVEECSFEYGPDQSYGTSVPCEPTPPANNQANLVRAQIFGLTPGATYHYRLRVSTDMGDDESEDKIFEVLEAPSEVPCSNSKALGVSFLPDCRAWEMVSPADKNGGYVVPWSYRTRAAADGSAISFISLSAFGDANGSGGATEYMAERSTDADPGHSGWSTHAITPKQDPNPFDGFFANGEPRYQGEFSPNLDRGVFLGRYPLTDDPYVEPTFNVYRRTDLRTPGPGAYDLLTACLRCQLTGEPLPPFTGQINRDIEIRPNLAGSSPDLSRVAFESVQRLTLDTPVPPSGQRRSQLFEWEDGEARLVGRIPAGAAIECNDAAGPACKPAETSVGGAGVRSPRTTGAHRRTPHVVSDGSDGNHRVFFTVPMSVAGTIAPDSHYGNIYARINAASTIKLNASERANADAFAPALYQDATADGSRIFFTSQEALTDDAPISEQYKLYMYDAN